MAKRRSTERQLEAAETVDELEAVAAEASIELPYTEGRWEGMPNYQCRQCPFASVELERTLLHIAQRHQPDPLDEARRRLAALGLTEG